MDSAPQAGDFLVRVQERCGRSGRDGTTQAVIQWEAADPLRAETERKSQRPCLGFAR